MLSNQMAFPVAFRFFEASWVVFSTLIRPRENGSLCILDAYLGT